LHKATVELLKKGDQVAPTKATSGSRESNIVKALAIARGGAPE
jgi:hypothetical protein